MKEENSLKNYIVVIVFALIFALIIYIPKIFNKNNDGIGKKGFNIISKDKYNVNEYIPIYVDDEQMSRKYLMDYIINVSNDVDNSYNLLNKEYRNYKFGSLDKYKEYINSLGLSISFAIDKYSTYNRQGYKYYDMYDKAGNRFIFRTNGVMQYEVLFDDYKFN